MIYVFCSEITLSDWCCIIERKPEKPNVKIVQLKRRGMVAEQANERQNRHHCRWPSAEGANNS